LHQAVVATFCLKKKKDNTHNNNI